LCEGVIATAERLRHLAWQSAQQPPGSPGLTVTSARQAAETSTVTSHNCAIIARVLAARTSHDASAISADLAAEAHAAQHGDLPQVVAAVHHACEALALLSETEHSQLRAAAQAGRILVPTRTLPDDYDIPRPYATAPPQHTAPLLARYRDAIHASHQATTPIERAAQVTGAPSRTLTTARAATQTTPSGSPAANPDDQATPGGREQTRPVPGPLQQALLGLGINSPALLARGADLDQASERLLIEAADEMPPTHRRPSAATLNVTAGTAALLNHALASGNPKRPSSSASPARLNAKNRNPNPDNGPPPGSVQGLPGTPICAPQVRASIPSG
jgi:hypothetical protein